MTLTTGSTIDNRPKTTIESISAAKIKIKTPTEFENELKFIRYDFSRQFTSIFILKEKPINKTLATIRAEWLKESSSRYDETST